MHVRRDSTPKRWRMFKSRVDGKLSEGTRGVINRVKVAARLHVFAFCVNLKVKALNKNRLWYPCSNIRFAAA
jgi:hypothetical protein